MISDLNHLGMIIATTLDMKIMRLYHFSIIELLEITLT